MRSPSDSGKPAFVLVVKNAILVDVSTKQVMRTIENVARVQLFKFGELRTFQDDAKVSSGRERTLQAPQSAVQRPDMQPIPAIAQSRDFQERAGTIAA